MSGQQSQIPQSKPRFFPAPPPLTRPLSHSVAMLPETQPQWTGNAQNIIVQLGNESTYGTAIQVENGETIEQVVIRVLRRIYPIAPEQYQIKHIYNADNWELCRGWSACSHLSRKWIVLAEKSPCSPRSRSEYYDNYEPCFQETEVEKKSCCVLQ